jgi:hypothetical protein
MQFFLFDFALAFVALLGYRTLVVVTRQGAPAGSPERGKPQPPPARAPRAHIARLRRQVEPQRVPPPWQEEPRRASLHRLINFW